MTAPHCRPRLRASVVPAVLLALGLTLGVSGCGSDDQDGATPAPSASPAPASSSPAPTTSAPAAAALIVIRDFAYTGATQVVAGATVSVRNEDDVAHTVTADRGSAFGVTVQAGETVTFTAPTKRRSYAYHCVYHADMHGTLRVV